MHKTVAPASALKQQATELVAAAALLELDLEAAQRHSRRVGAPTSSSAPGARSDKRANRSTLDEIAASLPVSRSTMNRILGKPPLRGAGRYEEYRAAPSKRHAHGTGLRRHDGAGGRNRGDLHRQSARTAHILAAAS
jgi:hypothetical protein